MGISGGGGGIFLIAHQYRRAKDTVVSDIPEQVCPSFLRKVAEALSSQLATFLHGFYLSCYLGFFDGGQ